MSRRPIRGDFIEHGEALRAIRDSRLYRPVYGTFEAYCRQRWGFSRQRAYQLIAAAEVIENLEATEPQRRKP